MHAYIQTDRQTDRQTYTCIHGQAALYDLDPALELALYVLGAPASLNMAYCNEPNLPTNIIPTDIARLKPSGKSPMGLGIPPL